MITANDVLFAATACNHVENRCFLEFSNICLAPWKLYLGDSKMKTDNFERVISRSPPNKEGVQGIYDKNQTFQTLRMDHFC